MFDDTRAQTTIDFSVGAGVFLLAVIFVFFFIQPLLAPFIGGQADVIRSDRGADRLMEDMLLEQDNPELFILDERCTLYFFEKMQSGSPTASFPNDCRYSASLSDINDAVGFESTKDVNITVEYSSSDNSTWVNPSDSVVTMENEVGTDVRLAIGEEPPSQGDVTVAQRHVYIGGDEYRLYVRVWGASLGNN